MRYEEFHPEDPKKVHEGRFIKGTFTPEKKKKKRNNRSLSSADGVGEDSESKNKLSELRSVAAFS